ncbi:sugar ABC transporter ATP-binding protein [Neoaquamicrobium sediminum]|uniref:sugar ABC transporter ATP-binding protein n=1 Tax=Neoaquamicrobium sediminum TaxID=1849104 RepID=UPI00156725BE|nr:sugar ABC transporter ATP-binding protein [Mesorhizobium sediminum]NRC57272.1 sugar ABC transporter ATP-binding protein [Mesorhizobium sediminum]
MGEAPLVEMTGVSKEFPGAKALSDVDFRLERGEVHVLFGENGAGKSTLISILSGVYRPTAGTLRIDGEEIELSSVQEARAAGIGTVFQEFSLVPTLSVFENVHLGKEPRRGLFVDRRAMEESTKALFDELGFEIDVRTPIARLSRAQQQMVEIAKALQAKARVLILDEPTASLTEKETEKLFSFIRRARDGGVGVIYISHRIQEFAAIADQITVLRDGKLIGTVAAREISEAALVELMTGRTIDKVYPQIRRQNGGEALLSLRGIRTAGVNGIDIDVRAGEVLGVAGLVGSGKSRVWRGILGLQPLTAGKVTMRDRDVTGLATRRLLRSGIFYLPPDRKSEGLVLTASARENIQLNLLDRADLTGLLGMHSPTRSRAEADAIGTRVDLAPKAMPKTVATLSGGNQQKVLFGKGFGEERLVYILDEPTVGVDMGTRSQLYLLIRDLTEAGKAVVVVSSDLPEVMHLSHRLVVFCGGRISAELEGTDISEETVLGHFFNGQRNSA